MKTTESGWPKQIKDNINNWMTSDNIKWYSHVIDYA